MSTLSSIPSSPPIIRPSLLAVDSALKEIEQVQDRVRICHSQLTALPLRDLLQQVETCRKALAEVQKTVEGGRDKKVQRQCEILNLDFDCLVDRVACISRKQIAPLTPTLPKEEKGKAATPPRAPGSPRASVARSYLPFVGGVRNLAFAKRGCAQELKELLERLGLLHQLNVEFPVVGTTSMVRFRHGYLELLSLTLKYPELWPFFWEMPKEKHELTKQGVSCFGTDRYHYGKISMKGLYEACPESQTLMTHSKDLVQKADRYFTGLKPLPLPVECIMSAESLSSDRKLLEEIFVTKGFQGVCAGEIHTERNSKAFIIDNLEAMRRMGVTTLFMESLLYDTMQPFLDDYYTSHSSVMPPMLAAYLEALDGGQSLTHPYTYTEIVRRAKEVGIRIVAIDTSVSHGTKETKGIYGIERPELLESFENRLKAMNYVAEQIIRHEKGPGKFIAFMGSHHAPTLHYKEIEYEDEEDSYLSPNEKFIPGLADLLRCPFIHISDVKDGPPIARQNIASFKIPQRGWCYKHVHVSLKRML